MVFAQSLFKFFSANRQGNECEREVLFHPITHAILMVLAELFCFPGSALTIKTIVEFACDFERKNMVFWVSHMDGKTLSQASCLANVKNRVVVKKSVNTSRCWQLVFEFCAEVNRDAVSWIQQIYFPFCQIDLYLSDA